MPSPIDTALLAALRPFIADRMGLSFPDDRFPELWRGLSAASLELGFSAPDMCARSLMLGGLTATQIGVLASHLTVGETYFFRDPASFDVLERKLLPPLIAEAAAAGRPLRLWSAGCCTGEEAYSLAIVCERLLGELGPRKVAILATDINPKFLAKAAEGVYSEWSFRGAAFGFRERYFSPEPSSRCAIAPRFKSVVRFAHANLVDDVGTSLESLTNAMDVILCRNVLMYFTPDQQSRVIAALHGCLTDGGVLLVNPAEAGVPSLSLFAAEYLSGALVHRKTSAAPRDAFAPPSPPLPPRSPTAPMAPIEVGPVAPPPRFPPRGGPAVEARPEDALTHARRCANLGRLAEALASCEVAMAADVMNPVAHYLGAAICEELGRLEDAVTALAKAVYLDQDFILAHYALGRLSTQLGRKKLGDRHLAIAIDLLSAQSRDAIVPESDGTTCGRLMESILALKRAT